MRGSFIKAILMTVPLLLPGICGAGAAGADEGGASGGGRAAATEDAVAIAFDRTEYLVYNLTGNMTINITFSSKSGTDENLSLSSDFGYTFRSYYAWMTSDLYKQRYLLLSPYESRTLQVNLSFETHSEYPTGFFGRMIYSVRAANSHIFSSNSTRIINYGPYSVKIVDPVPVLGEHHVLAGAALDITINVTNYSENALDGKLNGYGSPVHVTVGPKSSTLIIYHVKAYAKQDQPTMSFSLSVGSTITMIGFDMVEGLPANVTDASFDLIVQNLLDIRIYSINLDLGKPGFVNMTVISGADRTLKNIRFSVEFSGWLGDRISHRGEFTVSSLEPWSRANISYNVTPHVAGSFSLRVSTTLDGRRFSAYGDEFSIRSKASPSVYLPESHRGSRPLGGREFYNGSITNRYPYALRDVKLTVMISNDFRGMLSKEDFMDFQPREISIPVLESNQTAYFAFNVTLNSAGIWKLAVVASWEGNVSAGGDSVLMDIHVFRTRFEYSPIGIVITIAAAAAAPKVADIVIRRLRGIGS